VNDVLSPRSRRIRGFRVVGLAWDDEWINCLKKSQPEVWCLRLKHDRRTPVLDQVAFLSRQNDRTRRIVALLAAGHRRREVAERIGVSESALCQRLTRVRREWERFQAIHERSCDATLYRTRLH